MSDVIFSLAGKRVWVAGHRGMAGSAVVRRLACEPCEVLTVGHDRLDLRRQEPTEAWMADNRPDVVVLAAGTVGGIHANSTRPAEFLYDNMTIEANVIEGARRVGVQKLLFLGSSCIYPRLAPMPVTEDMLLSGSLEPTNEWYALAKISGIKLCQAYRRQYGCDFISAMPTNLYGPGDRYDLTQGHVVASLIMKIHQAKLSNAPTVTLWGTGTPLREFLFVDDLADGLVFLLTHYSDEPHVNLGSGIEYSIRHLAEAIARVAGWRGDFVFDPDKPDGTPRKCMDVSRMTAMGWTAKASFLDGLRSAYDWYVDNTADALRLGRARA